MQRMAPRKGLQHEEDGVVEQRQEQQVVGKHAAAEAFGRRDSPLAQILAVAEQGEQRRTQEGDEQRGDGVDPGGPHRTVHRHAQRQPRPEQHDGRRVERQQHDEGDIDERIEVNADRQVVEQEHLQQHRGCEEGEVW